MRKVARWAAMIAMGAALSSGCSSDPNGAQGGTAKGLHGGPSKVLDGPFTWPSDATLTAVSTGPTSALLSWPASTGSVGVADYRIYKDGHPSRLSLERACRTSSPASRPGRRTLWLFRPKETNCNRNQASVCIWAKDTLARYL
jgi:hypothetical protein